MAIILKVLSTLIFVLFLKSSESIHDRNLLRSAIHKLDENTLYYIPSTEGLIAHLHDILAISDIMKIYKRKVVILKFKSHHYPDLLNTGINICDSFEIYNEMVSCSNNITKEDVLISYQCYECIDNSFATSWNKYLQRYNKQIIVSKDFQYSLLHCYIGKVYYEAGIFDRDHVDFKRHILGPGLENFRISSNYLKYYSKILQMLSISSDHIVIH